MPHPLGPEIKQFIPVFTLKERSLSYKSANELPFLSYMSSLPITYQDIIVGCYDRHMIEHNNTIPYDHLALHVISRNSYIIKNISALIDIVQKHLPHVLLTHILCRFLISGDHSAVVFALSYILQDVKQIGNSRLESI